VEFIEVLCTEARFTATLDYVREWLFHAKINIGLQTTLHYGLVPGGRPRGLHSSGARGIDIPRCRDRWGAGHAAPSYVDSGLV